MNLINLKNILKIAKNQIKRGSQGIIAGCAELPLVHKNGDIEVPIIDPTLVLAKKAVEKSNKRRIRLNDK